MLGGMSEWSIIIIIIIIMEKTDAGLRGLCIREIDVKSQILVTEYYSIKYGFRCHGDQCYNHKALPDRTRTYLEF